jgi:Tfp pilus assembly protein PilF
MLPAIVLLAAFGAAQDPQPLQTSPAGPQAVASAPATNAASASAAIDAGLSHFVRHQFSQAEIDFRRALDADPNSAAAAFYLAYTYYKIAEPKRPFHPEKQKAAAMFAKAYALDPSFKPVWGTPAAPRR